MEEIVFEYPPFIRVYKDGHAERILVTDIVPPSIDPTTGVSSKDVVIQPETGLSARLFLPKVVDPSKKLPLLIYFHGGGFIIHTASSPTYHNYLNQLVAQANVVAVSVDFRRAPEDRLPVAYEDSWETIEWVIAHSKKDEWLSNYADYDRVFIAGDSAGGNIAQNMAIRAGVSAETGLQVTGTALVHPYFCGAEPIGNEIGNPGVVNAQTLWRIVCPATTGLDDPLINPAKDPNLPRLGCKKVLVCVAGADVFRDRGIFYFDNLKGSGWNGGLDFLESEGEPHIFHLSNPTSENAKILMAKLVSFINSAE